MGLEFYVHVELQSMELGVDLYLYFLLAGLHDLNYVKLLNRKSNMPLLLGFLPQLVQKLHDRLRVPSLRLQPFEPAEMSTSLCRVNRYIFIPVEAFQGHRFVAYYWVVFGQHYEGFET